MEWELKKKKKKNRSWMIYVNLLYLFNEMFLF